MSRRNGRPRIWRLLMSSVTAIGLMLVLLAPTLANAATAKVHKPSASLTARWWQEFVAIPDTNSFDRCDVGTRKVLFLAGTTGGSDTRICTTDKNLFLVPLINVECSTAEGNGTKFRELRRCAKDIADDFTDLKLEVDGQPVTDLNKLRVTAKSTFTSVENSVFFPTIPAATNSKFASDGYWALITLTPGEHTLIFGGTFPVPPPGPSFQTEVTYTLHVN
jgi:hypothetical protein